VGLFLHEILEHLDFQGDLRRQAIDLNARFAPRYGFEAPALQDTLVAWISHIVKTPLNAQGLCLAALPRAKRLNELEFDFAIDKVHIPALNAVLDDYAGEPLQALGVEDLRGMITGVIDLVFEHDGRFYIADYKSNLLGNTLADYTPERLRRAMLDRRYDLQYLLYILALHRYLQQRVPGYEYGRHMGGAIYLFLRALRPAHGPACGVFHDLPPAEVIDRLNLLVLAAPSREILP
jgi:exodeoxyribonuclease V beta subunit